MSIFKLNSNNVRVAFINGEEYTAFKVGQLPKRFALTKDEVESLPQCPGRFRSSIRG